MNAFDGMDLSPFLKVEEEGTLIHHPASMYTTRWENAFTEGFVSAWLHPETPIAVTMDIGHGDNATGCVLAEIDDHSQM